MDAQKHTEKHRRVPRQVALRTVKLCKVTPKTLTNSDVYGFTSSGILRRESLDRLREEVFQSHSVQLAGFALSKRAQSTTLTSLRLESTICRRPGSDYRKTLIKT